MDWIQFVIFMVACVGFLWSMKSDMNAYRTEAQADRRDLIQLIRSIEIEMKDFHGRLERQDAEFKTHMMYFHTQQK